MSDWSLLLKIDLDGIMDSPIPSSQIKKAACDDFINPFFVLSYRDIITKFCLYTWLLDHLLHTYNLTISIIRQGVISHCNPISEHQCTIIFTIKSYAQRGITFNHYINKGEVTTITTTTTITFIIYINTISINRWFI